MSDQVMLKGKGALLKKLISCKFCFESVFFRKYL